MKILINGQEFKDDCLDNNPTLGELMVAIQQEHVPQGNVVTEISVDGDALTAELLKDWKGRTIDQFKEIHIATEARNSYAAYGLRLAAENLHQNALLREQIVQHIAQGHSQEAMESFANYLQAINGAQQTLVSACHLMEVEPDSLEIFDQTAGASPQSQSVGDYINRLTDLLEQVKDALSAGDMVLLGDILEYEFADLPEKWHRMLSQLAEQFYPKE